MQIEDYLDVEKLEDHITTGIVERKRHAVLPLNILCYSRRATYEDIWDDITTKTRGLVVADDGTIIARPFEKFFNIGTSYRPETWPSNLTFDPPIVLEKLDGSLGILWEYDGFTGVASKGSFNSDHAQWATAWYLKNCKNPQWPVGFTPVFEMICQSVQKHVVLYDIPDQLILLALVNNETGEEVDYNTLYHYAFLNGLKTADVFAKSVGDVLNEDRPNKEGYVLSWPVKGKPPLKIKVKHETFLKLQKIVHAATPKNILEEMAKGNREIIETWKNSLSPELADFVREWSEKFFVSFGTILTRAKAIVDVGKERGFETRKEFAYWFINGDQFKEPEGNRPYAAVCFNLLDRESASDNAWKLVSRAYETELTRRSMGDPYDDEDKE